MLVLPASVAPKLHYSRGAIALALALWAGADASPTTTARVESPSEATKAPWRQPRRWARQLARRSLFRSLPRSFTGQEPPKDVAVSDLQALAGLAHWWHRRTSVGGQAFHGAELAG